MRVDDDDDEEEEDEEERWSRMSLMVFSFEFWSLSCHCERFSLSTSVPREPCVEALIGSIRPCSGPELTGAKGAAVALVGAGLLVVLARVLSCSEVFIRESGRVI